MSGIALPSGSDKLYTGSKDETVRVWDCQSGQVGINFLFDCYLLVLIPFFSFLVPRIHSDIKRNLLFENHILGWLVHPREKNSTPIGRKKKMNSK